ncbi:hypothetical protein E3N88_38590 [Mikania micrantha]|uniref:Uncharacterized protein n=1 Tax=Mikania micrantha TaxID=192012 RepID=A0A5N6LUF4_9ASTR|nr:hypothetical protein E3N88_38590 [Mikania micrantha]
MSSQPTVPNPTVFNPTVDHRRPHLPPHLRSSPSTYRTLGGFYDGGGAGLWRSNDLGQWRRRPRRWRSNEEEETAIEPGFATRAVEEETATVEEETVTRAVEEGGSSGRRERV